MWLFGSGNSNDKKRELEKRIKNRERRFERRKNNELKYYNNTYNERNNINENELKLESDVRLGLRKKEKEKLSENTEIDTFKTLETKRKIDVKKGNKASNKINWFSKLFSINNKKRIDNLKRKNMKPEVISSLSDLTSIVEDDNHSDSMKDVEFMKKNMKKSMKKKKSFKDFSLLRKIFRIFWVTLLILIILGIIGISIVVARIYNKASNKYKIEDLTQLIKKKNSVIYDRNGKEILALADDEYRRMVSSQEIPKYLKDAYISIEDQRFYSHIGVDFTRTLGATIKYFITKNKSYGGSTITQQLIKNATQDDDRSWQRKLREIVRALDIEKRLSKDEILELYLNIIYVGGRNIRGVSLASDYYFNKKVKDISLAESAFLAGINHMPANYDPFISKGFEEIEKNGKKEIKITDQKQKDRYDRRMALIKNRVKTVLYKMKELNKISDEDLTKALKQADEGLKFKQGNLSRSNVIYSHVVDGAIEEAISIIMKQKNMTYEVAEKALYNSGYKIYITQDTKKQEELQNYMESQKNLPKDSKGRTVQSVVAVMDHTNGEIICAVGGLGKDAKMVKGDWNRLTRSKRQTGSSIKPIAVVGPGLESGALTAATVFDDCAFSIGNWKPTNFARNYLGLINIRKAIEESNNIVHVKALQKVGINTSYEFLKKMDLPVQEEDKSLASLALGGLTHGFTAKDMIGAYGMIANDGEYIKPTFIVKIEDSEGKQIYKNEAKKKKIMSPQNAYVLKKILTETVYGSRGTAKICAVRGFESAGKSGTTNDDYERWLCGFTTKYTAVAWAGYDYVKSLGYFRPNPYYKKAMEIAHRGLKGEKFKEPKDIVWVNIDRVSGKLPTELSARDPRGSRIYSEVFRKGTEPKEKDDIHVEATICKISNKLASPACDPKNVEKRVFLKRENRPETADNKYRLPTETCEICKSKNAQKLINDKKVIEKLKEYLVKEDFKNEKIEKLNSIILDYDNLENESKKELEEFKEKIEKIRKIIKSKEEKEAEAIDKLIDDIPLNITKANLKIAKEKYKLAESKYNNSSKSIKAKVKKKAKLDKAKSDIAKIKE